MAEAVEADEVSTMVGAQPRRSVGASLVDLTAESRLLIPSPNARSLQHDTTARRTFPGSIDVWTRNPLYVSTCVCLSRTSLSLSLSLFRTTYSCLLSDAHGDTPRKFAVSLSNRLYRQLSILNRNRVIAVNYSQIEFIARG